MDNRKKWPSKILADRGSMKIRGFLVNLRPSMGLARGPFGCNSSGPVLQIVRLIGTRIPEGFLLSYVLCQWFSFMPSADMLLHQIFPCCW